MQSFRRQEHALIYTIPALALTFVFFVVPLGYLIVVSLFKWNGLGPMEFTGLGNYEYIFRNANFHKAFRVTLLWLASALIVHIPFGLLLSLMLNRRPHGWKFLRVMYFIPNVISTTAVAFMWYFIYHADMGLLNASCAQLVGKPGQIMAGKYANRPDLQSDSLYAVCGAHQHYLSQRAFYHSHRAL